ncbi:MAG: molecular chaperone HtpG [Gemmatimonadetes bacterium]|nr:molecular chaperone HtpG [Gemmatimonadota bacterium]
MSSNTFEFQAEVRQLLDLMVHSLYSHKDVFLRELISNASDAIDKRRFEGLTDASMAAAGDPEIVLERDPEARTLTIRDNGIGMSRDEVMENIGTIARSGTQEFLARARELKQDNPDPELIGQFGVGFYSAFMVADRVDLETRRAGEETATRWISTGDGSYTLSDAERDDAGTTITLHLRAADEEDGLQDYTEEWVVREIVKKFSDFVAYPIRMKVERTEQEKDADGNIVEGGAEIQREQVDTLNSMKAIWRRPKDDVSEEEYSEFYKHICHDWSDPLLHLTSKMEGAFEASALLFVPSTSPFDLHHPEMSRKGLQLYVKRVFIMDECRDLMPDYLRFIRGVIDAEDVSLNISREMLQKDRQIQAIQKHLTKKVLDTLVDLHKDDPEKYRTFWGEFGPVLKEGLMAFGDRQERILDLVLAASTNDEKELTSLDQYIERMKEDQDAVYYMTGTSREAVLQSPHIEAFREKGYEVLLLTDRVDEVWLGRPQEYKEKKLQSIGHGEVDLGSDEEKEETKKELEEKKTEFTTLLEKLQSVLDERVKEVRLSTRLTSSAACLVGDTGDLSPQLEAMMRESGQKIPSMKRILELNPDHAVLAKLRGRFDENPEDESITEFAELLYGQAVLAEGAELEDPAGFSKRVADLMTKAI